MIGSEQLNNLGSRRPEVIENFRRNDPAAVLFLSGAGFKVFDPHLPWLGVSARLFAREEPKRVDDLIIAALDRDLITDAQKRGSLAEPIYRRGSAVSLVFDMPGEAFTYWPRVRYTYENFQTFHSLEVRFPSVRDIRDEVHRFTVLSNTAYLGNSNRYRLTFEPIYEAIVRTTAGTDPGPRENVDRGVLNVVFDDDYAVREVFLQAVYGEGEHKRIPLNPIEAAIRAEFRQWYGYENTAFTALGVGYSELDFKVPNNAMPDDIFRQFDIFALLITELDQQGLWRLALSGSFNRTDIDFTSFPPAGGVLKKQAKIDFYKIDARLTKEVIPDVDVTGGLEYSAADQSAFDSIGILGQIAMFNFGPWRAEFGARGTFYHNVNAALGTLYTEVNFAQ